MAVKFLISLVSLLVGGWMIFDGIHVLLTGKYFGPEKPGPWSDIVVAATGLDPFQFGVPFITLGILWLAFAAAMLFGQNWAWYAALITAVLTLWYLPVGTVLSVVYIALLIVFRSRFVSGT
jgi:hypothetical protein